MKYFIHFFLVLLSLPIVACGSNVKIDRPTPITLESGLREMVDALKLLNELSDATKEEDKVGLIPSQVQIQLQVGVTEQEGGINQIQIVPGSIVSEIANVTSSKTVQVNEDTGSTITLTFTNYLFAAANSILGTKEPDEIKVIRDGVIKGGPIQFGNRPTE